MAQPAKRLPVVLIPEQRLVSLVRHDVIYVCCRSHLALPLTLSTQRVGRNEAVCCSCSLWVAPTPRIATLCCCASLLIYFLPCCLPAIAANLAAVGTDSSGSKGHWLHNSAMGDSCLRLSLPNVDANLLTDIQNKRCGKRAAHAVVCFPFVCSECAAYPAA
jgi:hypothetical protein